MKLPDDPKDHYVYNPVPVTLEDLATRYEGKMGCSIANLKRRCNKEKWRKSRADFFGKVNKNVEAQILQGVATIVIKSIEELDNDHLNEVRYFKNLIYDRIKQDIVIVTSEDGTETRTLKMSPGDLARLIESISKLQRDERLFSGLEPDKIYFKGQGDSKFIEDHFGDLREIEIVSVEDLNIEDSTDD